MIYVLVKHVATVVFGLFLY